MKEINNTKELTNEELLNISAGGSCTWKKGIIEGVSGAMIGGLAGPWGAAAGAVTGVGSCVLGQA